VCRRLAASLSSAAESKAKGALERAADAYIRRAQEAPALFRLMFSRELVNLSRFPEAAAAGDKAFDRLTGIVAAFAPPERVRELALAAWSLVHGYATLCVEVGLESESRRTARARLFARIIRSAASTPRGE
jgi:hypothetical protein